MSTMGIALILALVFSLVQGSPSFPSHRVVSYGATVRMDTTKKEVFLVFTGHEFADGGDVVASALRKNRIKASFFFTGDFYRNPHFARLIETLRDNGHYLGPHSDRHLLYVSWENRDSMLVTSEEFRKDLLDNYAAMRPFRLSKKTSPYFMPPFEWYNAKIVEWSRELGVAVVNFTPGTSSNADYSTPSMGERYVPTDSIFQRILRYEKSHPSGLNGFILLMHIGTDPTRTDKFYDRLDELIAVLHGKGYSFRSLRK